ncbi:MAG: CHAT domain-containing protein [bacterium]|nr:CHAT domain-containing protein [bacterium]
MKILICLIFLFPAACSSPFELANLTSAEEAVIEKVSAEEFSVKSIRGEENARLLSAARKYIADSQPEFAGTLLKCVNREKMDFIEDKINYYYLSSLVKSHNNNPGGALRDVYRSLELCKKTLKDPALPADIKDFARLFHADLNSYISTLYRSLGNYKKALTFAGEAAAAYSKPGKEGLHLKLIQSYVFQAELYSRLGKKHFKEAKKVLALAEQVFNRSKEKITGDDDEQKQWQQSFLGYTIAKIDFLIKSGNREELEKLFTRAEDLAEDLDNNKSLARIWLLRATEIEERETGRKDRQAFKSLLIAVEYAEKSGDTLLLAVAEHRTAFLIDRLSGSGEYEGEKSIGHLEKALENFSILNNTFNVESEYSRYFSMLLSSYERYIDLLVDTKETAKALFYVEKLRSRKLRNLLARKKMNPENLLDPKFKKEIKKKQVYRDYLLKQYMKQSTSFYHSHRVESERILAKIKYVDKEIAELREKAELLSHGFRLVTQNPVDVDDARALLREDQALILFHLKENNTAYRWIITNKEVVFKKILLTSSISGLIREMRKGIGIGYFSKRAIENSHFIYNRLFKDLLDINFDKKHWIIAPHKNIALVPFDALVTGFDKRNRPLFLLDKDIRLSLTASLTVFAMQRKEKPIEYKKDFIGFADPYYGGKANQLYQSISETRRVGAFFRKKKILQGRAATESRFKRMNLSEYRFVHVSTHGDYLAGTLKEPIILFCLKGDPREDGFLLAREVYALDIKSQLVSFSACNTALGRREQYEGVVGFTHAFFTAGTKEILLTLWPVNANSAELFFVEFYKNVSRDTEPGEALFKAKKRVRRSYSNPYHWAAMVHQF